MNETYFCPICGTELKQGNYGYDENTGCIHVENCPNCTDGNGMTVNTQDDAEMIADNFAHPAIYNNKSKEYEELESLEGDFWGAVLDELAKLGYTITYNNVEDCYVVG